MKHSFTCNKLTNTDTTFDCSLAFEIFKLGAAIYYEELLLQCANENELQNLICYIYFLCMIDSMIDVNKENIDGSSYIALIILFYLY